MRGARRRPPVRWSVVLVVAACLSGCAWLRRDQVAEGLPPCAEGARGSSPLEACLSLGDTLFARRADPGRLDAAISTWLDALSLNPQEPRTLERLTRAYATRGYANPEGAAQDYATARGMGLQCLQTDPDLRAMVTASGGLLTSRAIASLKVDMASCALWTASAWARTLALRGVAGAAVDLRAVRQLAERARALDPAAERQLADAVLGLVLALPPQPLGPDLEAAESHLRAAVEAAPGRLTPAVDLAEWVFARRGDAEAWREALERIEGAELARGDPDLLENQRAVARATAALALGLPEPASWWRP